MGVTYLCEVNAWVGCLSVIRSTPYNNQHGTRDRAQLSTAMETEKQGRWARLKERSRDERQLVIRNARNYDEMGVYRLTPLNVYLAVSTLLVVVAAVVILIVAYTPLREYIPGYGGDVDPAELHELEGTVDELSEVVTSQQLYIETLRRTVSGVAITEDSLEAPAITLTEGPVTPLPPSEAELSLRREMTEARRADNGTAELPATVGGDVVPLAQVYLVPPVNGRVSATFNPVAGHLGVDVAAPRNTAVKAVRAGVVLMSEFTSANGFVIGIQHDNNLISFYKHNSRLLKEVGDRVKAGEAVAIIGDTGTQSTGPHLHFELWHEGRAVDAGEYLTF